MAGPISRVRVAVARTPAALAEAERGNALIVVGCVVLLVAAVSALRLGPRWAAMSIALPAVVCGGLALVASETLLPQVAALPTLAAALAGAIAVAFTRM